MSHEQQREAITVLAEIWSLSPEVRLGQLFAHLGFMGETERGRSLGYIDDDELLSILYRHRDELRARQVSAPPPALSLSSAVPGNVGTTKAGG